MTRKTLLVPLFVALLILAPTELSGEDSPTTTPWSPSGGAQG